MSELLVMAHHTVAPGHEDEVFTLLAQLIEAARTEPGNVSFVAYRQLDDPRSYVLLERYTSREAFTAHRETEHFTRLLLNGIAPRLSSREIETYDVPG